MSYKKHSDEVQQKLSFLDKIISVFRGQKIEPEAATQLEHLDQKYPKYWPEVVEFMELLNHIVDSHTISDGNVERINHRIIEYIEEQINIKGQIEDVEERYSALKTLSDRILSHNLNKLVGLKVSADSNTDFSDAVNLFKYRLEERKIKEQQAKKSIRP